MVGKTEATEIARQYLVANPLPSTKYKWTVPDPVRTSNGWVFEYAYECLDDTPPDKWECFGGAPGFLVKEDGSVRDLEWREM